MKLKQSPEDFQVEELTNVSPGPDGPFALYRMEKRGWSTPDAIQAIRRRWRIEPRRLSYGGLKDRHAWTIQYLTIFHGPRRRLTHQDVKVEYLGQVCAPYSSQDIRANRFQLTLRDLDDLQLTKVQGALEELRRDGAPNYYDDQRFGSVDGGGEFIARLMVKGRFEDALKQALAAPYAHDRARQKKDKAILLEHWGDWPTCKKRLPRSHAPSLVDYLVHQPTDFRGALARLRPELRGLYMSAYQSHLWNRMLALWIRRQCRPEQIIDVRLRLGDMPMCRSLDESQRTDLASLVLPLPSARLKMDPADPRMVLVQAVLNEEGLELKQLQIKGIREMFFSRGERAALCLPQGINATAGEDELHSGHKKLTLAFELARGSYATLIVKRITAFREP